MVDATRQSRKTNRCQLCAADISCRGWQSKFCEPCGKYRRCHYRTPLDKLPPRRQHYGCAGCGNKFKQPQWQEFCSRECQGRNAASKRFQQTLTKQCLGCGQSFTTTNPKRSDCTKACLQWRLAHPGVLRVLDRECDYCRTPFTAAHARQKYCRLECCRQTHRQRRQHRKNQRFIEDVSTEVVAQRDKWRCQLCDQKVNPALQWPHPLSKSLDHIIPISCGGEHSYANTQLAHLVCNIRKRDKTQRATQLALIG